MTRGKLLNVAKSLAVLHEQSKSRQAGAHQDSPKVAHYVIFKQDGVKWPEYATNSAILVSENAAYAVLAGNESTCEEQMQAFLAMYRAWFQRSIAAMLNQCPIGSITSFHPDFPSYLLFMLDKAGNDNVMNSDLRHWAINHGADPSTVELVAGPFVRKVTKRSQPA